MLMGLDAEKVKMYGNNNSMYIVVQVVLSQKILFGTGSDSASLNRMQKEINKYAAMGYRLHTFSTASSGAKGWAGEDKIQTTMVFEKIL